MAVYGTRPGPGPWGPPGANERAGVPGSGVTLSLREGFLLAAEIAAERLAIRRSAEGGRDPVPGPVGGSGLPYRQGDRVLGHAPRLHRVLYQFLDRRHAMKLGT
jgi:hypothetical protein